MEASAPRPITAATESEYRVSTGSPTDPRRIACQPVKRLGGVGWGGVGWIGVGLGWAELGWAGLGWAGWVRIGCKRRKGAAPSSRPSLPHASAPQVVRGEASPLGALSRAQASLSETRKAVRAPVARIGPAHGRLPRRPAIARRALPALPLPVTTRKQGISAANVHTLRRRAELGRVSRSAFRPTPGRGTRPGYAACTEASAQRSPKRSVEVSPFQKTLPQDRAKRPCLCAGQSGERNKHRR